MSERYDHKAIEKKWQDRWRESQIFRASEDASKPKTYVLDMFPYPSGEGLHVGHPKGYIATDIYSRFKRMQGHSVLHPMGWDAFGLPAENFALKNKIHPRIAVEKNISTFKNQLAEIGFDYDWSREINTTDPAYYKWTQWIFLQLYKKGLAYQSNEPINWCPSCMTGLANEDLDGQVCERCDTPVEKKTLPQWVLKITDYADRMLADLDLLQWPEHIKVAQRNWIGRKEGVIVSHAVIGSDIILDTFSAYPAWLYADTYIVIAPEHPLVEQLVKGTDHEAGVKDFVQEIAKKTSIEREGAKEKLGIFTGRYVDNPFKSGEQMPVWLANFALMDFGTGIIRCSSHDERDFEFAQKYAIPLRWVVGPEGTFVSAHDNAGLLKNSGPFTGKEITPTLIQEMVEWMVKEHLVARRTTYRLQDWVFSRQRYWGEPIPIIHCEKDGAVAVPEDQLPVLLPEVDHYEPSGTGESPLANITEWVNTTCPSCGGPAKRETNTMPQWAGSSWYYLRFMDPHNADALVGKDKEKYWAPVDVYVGGDHAVRHLIYARFWHKFLFDIGSVSTPEPFARLEFLGFILAEDGKKMSKRMGNVINPTDVIARYGADSFRIYEMFMGPFENTVAWNTASIAGTTRFIDRVWRLAAQPLSDEPAAADLERILHQTAKKVTEDIEAFKFNTAVAQMMTCLNAMEEAPALRKGQWRAFVRLLAPFAPHIAEELWEKLAEPYSVHQAAWPQFDASKIALASVKIAIQVNGKVRGSVELAAASTEEEALAAARSLPAIAQWLAKGEEKKALYVAGKIISFVVE